MSGANAKSENCIGGKNKFGQPTDSRKAGELKSFSKESY